MPDSLLQPAESISRQKEVDKNIAKCDASLNPKRIILPCRIMSSLEVKLRTDFCELFEKNAVVLNPNQSCKYIWPTQANIRSSPSIRSPLNMSPQLNYRFKLTSPEIADICYCVITFHPRGQPIGSVKIYKDLYGY